MNEKELRTKAVATARTFLGTQQGSTAHKKIIDTFNKIKPDGWAMTYTAPWCATFASAIAVLAFGEKNAIKYFPLSANCPRIITKAKDMKIFVENDAYVPKAGDWILYDWQDSGKGENKTGAPDHVGIVEKVAKGTITVVEGNFSTLHNVGERNIYINGKYIRGFVTPKYSAMADQTPKKTVAEIAQEVLDGKWGNGDDRKKKLEAAGYKYADVQKAVNDLVAKKETKPVKKKTESQKMVDLATKQLGNGYKKYCKAYGKNTSWCQIFLWWLFDQRKMKYLKDTFARHAAAWAKKHWPHVALKDAKAGDVVYFVRGKTGHNKMKGTVVHTGMVRKKPYQKTDKKGKKYWVIPTIEGNVGTPGKWKTNIVGKRNRNENRVWGIFRPPYANK